jgi:anti-sigma B factor antagonist
MSLEIEESYLEPNIVLLSFTGRITIGRNSQQIEWKTAELIRKNSARVIFDLADVDFIDSTGIGIVVMCSGKLKRNGGQLRLSGATGVVDQTLRMTGVDTIVPFHTTTAEAVAGFGGSANAAHV